MFIAQETFVARHVRVILKDFIALKRLKVPTRPLEPFPVAVSMGLFSGGSVS